MTPATAWIVGAGGLLGSHVRRTIGEYAPSVAVWDPGPPRIRWEDPSSALLQLEAQARRFIEAVLASSGPWALYWCAGSGVVGTTAERLEVETSYLEKVLSTLGPPLHARPGKVLLASSAGGVYGNNPEQPLTEHSRCMPISDYGRSKLRQEMLLMEWAQANPGISVLIARISNLYGPGQNMDKPQGLIAHISRSMIHHAPVHVYVPLDTLRDYVYVGDCAAHLVQGMERLGGRGPEHITKIFSAGETVTIAGVIASFARIAKGHPRIISSASQAGSLQPQRLQFKSHVWTDLRPMARTDLAVGIQRVHSYQLSLFQQGRLPPRLP